MGTGRVMKLSMDFQKNGLRGMKEALAGPEELNEKISQLEELAIEKGDTAHCASASGSF